MSPRRNAPEERSNLVAASVELLWAVLNNSADNILLANVDGRIAGVNDSAVRLLGSSRTELLEKTLIDLIAIPNDAFLNAGDLAQLPINGQWSSDCSIALSSGETMTVQVTIRRVTKDNLAVTIGDPRQDSHLKGPKKRKEELAEQNPYPVLRLSADGVILYANPASLPFLEEWGASIGELVPTLWREQTELALRDGSTRSADISFDRHTYSIAIVPDSLERCINLYGFDVTALRRAENSLRKRAEQHRSLVEQASDGIFITESDGSRLEVNAAGCAMSGYTRSELRGMNLVDLFLKEDLATSPVRFDEVLAGKTIRGERRLRRKDGSTLPVEISARMLPDGRFQGIVRDISERKRTEVELQKERGKLAVMAETLPGMLCQLTRAPDGILHVRYASAVAADITGFYAQELLERSSALWELVHPEDREVVYELIEESEHLMIPCIYQFRYRHPTKGEIWLEGQTIPRREDGGSVVWHGFFTDVSDRIRAENTLRENEEKYRALFLGSRDAVLLSSPDGIIQAANPAACIMFGRTESEICTIGREGIVDTGDGRLAALLEERRRTGKAVGELTMLRSDGLRFPAELSSSVFLDSRGRQRTSMIIRDITERKEAEDRLRRSEQKFSTLFHKASLPAALSLLPDSTIVDVNEAWEEMFQYPRERTIGKTPSELGILRSPEATSSAMEELRKGNAVPAFEQALFSKSGESHTVLTSISAIEIDGEDFALSSFQDITDRKNAESRLRQSEERFAQIRDSTFAFIVSYDLQGRVTSANRAFCEALQFTDRDVVGKTHAELGFSHSECLEWEAMHRHVAERDRPLRAETTSVRPDGSVHSLDVDLSPMHDAFGGLVGVSELSRDITQRKRAEDKVRRLNRTHAVLSSISQLIVRERDAQRLYQEACRIATEEGEFLNTWIGLLDDNRRTVYPVASAGVSAGYPREISIDITGRNELGLTGRAILSGEAVVSQDIENDARLEPWKETALTYGFKSSGAFPLRVAKVVIGSINLYSKDVEFFDEEEVRLLEGLAMDLSFALNSLETERERARAEKSLQESERKYRILAESSPEMIYVVGIDGRVIYLNNAATIPFGTVADDLVGKHLTEILPTEMARANLESIRSVIETGQPHSQEILQRFPSGDRWIESRLSPVRDENGETTSVLGLSTDITERRNAEETLIRLRSAVHASGEVIFMTDSEGVFTFVNNAFTDLYGYTAEDVVGTSTPRILKSGQINDQEYVSFWSALIDGQTVKREWINRTRGGKMVIVYITANPIMDARGSTVGFLAIQRNVTQQRNLEEQIRQSQKMESLGTLASGIAHDFNNILTIILGHVSIIEKYRQDPERFSSSLKNINVASWRGAALVRQMLTFARKNDTEFQPLRINDAAREVEKLLSETFPKTIQIRFELDDGLPLIYADGTQIHQVLLNLCVNARDAMGERGILTVSTRAVGRDSIRGQFINADSDEYIEISVGDTGVGMDHTTIDRIFEPFFTTKERTKGTGLGLAVVFGIVRAHSGFIGVESQPAEGSTFHLYFPVYEEPAGNIADQTHSTALITGGNETILFVDDEESLRDSVGSILKDSGYTVLAEGDGAEAVKRFRAQAGDINLVICDNGLTGLTGQEVFQRIRAIDSTVRFILASGFIDPAEKAKFLMADRVEFLQKPYSANELLASARRLLDRNIQN